MDKKLQTLETISEIRSMMERSTRFISLNGLSGVFAGILALMGALGAYFYIKLSGNGFSYLDNALLNDGRVNISFFIFIFTDAFLVLFFSVVIAIILSFRKAKAKGVKFWDNSAKRLLVNLLIPLCIGGLFCVILIYHGLIGLVAPSMLIFYGLALINSSKYTVDDIRYLGITETIVGLLAAVWIGYGLLFWAFGFGILHILYGAIMYYKYER